MINVFYRFILSIDDFNNSVSSIFSVKFNWEILLFNLREIIVRFAPIFFEINAFNIIND